jgi:hypothetical protein
MRTEVWGCQKTRGEQGDLSRKKTARNIDGRKIKGKRKETLTVRSNFHHTSNLHPEHAIPLVELWMPRIAPSGALCELGLSAVILTPDILVLGDGLRKCLLGFVDFLLADAHALSVLIFLGGHFELWVHVGIDNPIAEIDAPAFAKTI